MVAGSGQRVAGHAADLALRRSHRRRPDRRSRASARLREHSGSGRDRHAYAGALDRSAGSQRARERSARRSRLSGSHQLRVHRSGVSGSAVSGACGRTEQRDLRGACGDARVAVARVAPGARQQSASPATARSFVRSRPSLLGETGETEVIAGVATGSVLPEQWGARRARSTSST